MPTFEDDFAKGEQEAARLVARMRASLDRAEAFERDAQKDSQLKRRLRAEGEAEARSGETEKPKTTPEETIKDRIKSEERLNKAIEERAVLERRATGETEANATANERAALAQRGPGSSIVPYAGGGGRGGPPQPPRFFGQPPPEEDPFYRRRLEAGFQPKQIPERTGPPYPGQKALPAAGQTGQGAKYYEDEARSKRASASAGREYAGSIGAQGRAAGELNGTLASEAGLQRAANLEFQRYGALSSEWIGATARGATTIQELGRQTTATIGKFGGWLGAGALLFTALDAVRAIGKGALESASGVNQLERVMTNVNGDLAQSQFRDYSKAFNLPIGDVSQAAYEMGKIFHNQNEAFEATKAVLYSVKVGELDTATASRYLIAIINGFHLPANQLVTVFDQLNGAQNKFGITISDVEAGLAKASGSFNAATTKGSPLQKYHELLALITTAQKATGQTGQVVGTAIQRAPNFLRQDKNKQILKKYGIDAGGDLNEVITKAFETAQTLPGHKIAELASAIFGPQYGARIGTPLFQQFDLYKKVLAGTSQQATKNSGQRELNTLLGTYGEKLKAVGVELENIGSGLAESGFLNVFGIALEGLTQFLGVTNDILEAFNKLPDPLKNVLSTIIEIKLAISALRKFNVGDNFAPGTVGRKVLSGPNRTARLYEEQLLGREGQERQALESNAVASTRSQRKLGVASDTLESEKRQLAILGAQGATQEEILAQQLNVNEADAAYQSARVRQLDLAQEQQVILRELISIEGANTALKGAFNNEQAAQLARSRGEIIPASFNKGRLSGRELAAQAGYEVDKAGNIVGQKVPPVVPVGGITKDVSETEAAAKASTGRLRGTYSKITGAIPSVEEAGATISRVGSGLGGLAGSMYDLAGGPLGVLIASAFLISEYGDDLARAVAGGQKEIENSEHIPEQIIEPQHDRNKNIKAYETRAQEIREKLLEDGFKATADEVKRALEVSSPPPGADKNFTYQDYLQQKGLREAQRRQLRQTGLASGLPSDVIRNQLEHLKELTPGSKEYQNALHNVRSNFQASYGTDKEKAANRAVLHKLEAQGFNASADVTKFFNSYNSIADKLLLNYIKNLGTLVSSGPAFAGQKDLHRFTNASIVQGVRDLVSNKPAIQAKGAQTLQELPQILSQYESQELKTSLTLAKTQAERERAYSKYIGSLGRSLKDVRGSFGSKSKEIDHKLSETQKDIKEYERRGYGGTISPQDAKHFGLSEAQVEQHDKDRAKLEELRERAKRLRRAGDEISQQQEHAERELKALIAEQREAQTQEHVGVLGELGEIAAARVGTQDPVGQARVTLAFAEKALSYVREHHGNPADRRQAVLAVLNARQQLEDSLRSEAQELASANATLAQAKANGDPIKEAQAEINKARADLGLARTAAERKNALAELINAEHKLEEDRANIAIASLQLEAAQTDNPVTQAAIKVREADLKLKQAHGKQAKLEARASRASAVREHRDAVAQASIENVEFQADLGRITADQEIAAYTRLLRTLKLSKQTKRELIEKIHALQEEASGNLELTVGNIQLPTIYDIRRAIGGGVNGSGRGGNNYSDSSTTNVEINISGGDTERVGRVVHDTIERSTKNSRRSAGLTKK